MEEMFRKMAESFCTDGTRGLAIGDRDQCGGCGGWFTVTHNSADGACNRCMSVYGERYE